MPRFSVDYYNKKSFFKDYDYSSKVILSSVSDTLFIYSNNQDKYVNNACETCINKREKEFTIIIRNDLYYYDGTKVKIDDYITSLKNIIDSNNFISAYYSNIKEIVKKNDRTAIIYLKKKDKSFIKKLSLYTISPRKNELTSGRYYIKTIDNNYILLYPNKYYRTVASDNLEFIILDSLDLNNNWFDKNKIDITNNTYVSMKDNDHNMKKEHSNIIFNIEISTKLPLKIRKKIIKSINKNAIAKKLGSNYFIKNDFFPNTESKSLSRTERIDGKNTKLRIAYNTFYPNATIAELIKQELETHNYIVTLFPYKYGDYSNKKIQECEIKLVLNYFEFIDNAYFYESKYFNYIMKNNILYKLLLKHNYKITNWLFCKKFIKEPLISFYSRYYTNNKTKNFSYLECDYNKIK